jgi:PAS domain S-box-containing protein
MTSSVGSPGQEAGESALYRTVFEQSPVSTQVFRPDGLSIAVNRAWERLWGTTLEAISPYNVLQDQQLVERGVMPIIERAFSGESVSVPPIRYVPESTVPGVSSVPFVWVAASLYPVKDEEGRIREIVLMHEDITERIEAEEALRASEERFRAIFYEAPIGISLIDPEGRYIAVNPARQEMLGYREEELLGRSYLDFTHPDDIEYDLEINDMAKGDSKTWYQLEKRFVRRNGEIAWARITIRAVRDDSGAILYSISTAEDITRHKEMEEALRQAEQRYRTLVEQLPIAAYLAPDEPGVTAYVSPGIERLLGYPAEEWTSQPDFWATVIHPDDRDRILARDLECRRTGERFREEFRIITRDGSVVWVHDEAIVARDENGHTWLHGVYLDVTERKQAEQERARLYELERTIRRNVESLAAERAAILSQIADGVIIADAEGRLTFVNEEARRIYGIAALGVTPEAYSSTYHVFTLEGELYPSLQLPLSRAVRERETTVNVPLRIRRTDGTEVIARASASPVTSEDGVHLGGVLAVRDVTAEYDLERQKEDFLSAAAHDLRTPLTSMKGRVQLLRRRAERQILDPASLVADLDRIDTGLNRMTSLIGELLDVANIQIGRPLALHRVPTNLVDLVKEVAGEQQHSSDRHRVRIEAENPEIQGSWDATRIERALSNLLSNAIKYSPRGGDIDVFLRVERDEAVLQVADQGIGIPEADLPHVFDRFRRGENAAGKIPGTGIGLAAVRDIVERHGGTITAENREGGGAIFTIRLPLDGA